MTLKARIRAIDRFVKGCREDGIYDDLNACCVMAGWDSLAGALTPLKGAAPTNNGFLAADFDRGIGITGDGTSYIDSGRAGNADGSSNQHCSVFLSDTDAGQDGTYIGARDAANVGTQIVRDTDLYFTSYGGLHNQGPSLPGTGFYGVSRSLTTSFQYRFDGTSGPASANAQAGGTNNFYIFSRPYNPLLSSATCSFYSIGSATDLALLDARVSTLMADLRAIEETGFDRDAIAYIRAVEEADGAYLETDVKIAVNNLVSGLKADGLWESVGSSCLLCGPRTLAGALVPLRGDAPTPYGFVSGDHSRTNGLGDPGGTSYLDSNRSGVADARNDHHIAFYSTSAGGATYPIGVRQGLAPVYYTIAGYDFYSRSASPGTNTSTVSVGTYGLSRDNGASFNWIRASGPVSSASIASQEVPVNDNHFVFALNAAGSAVGTTSGTLAFYSIGSSLDLAKLDSHISSYVTAIGAAI